MAKKIADPQLQSRGAHTQLSGHNAVVGEAAHRAMRHLAESGQQGVAIDPNVVFAELQDQGPTPRAPRRPAKT